MDIYKIDKSVLLPTNDVIFKSIYGKEGKEYITESFIKSFLDLDIKIDKLESEEPLEQDITSEKIGVLDVLATTEQGTKIDIEMQMGNYENIEEKLAFYGSKLFSGNVHRGILYKDIKKTIAVMILKDDYVKYRKFEEYKFRWNLREEKYHDLILTDKLELYIISLEKIRKQIAKGKIQDKEKIAIWTKFMLTPKELKEEEMEKNQEIKEANDIYNEVLSDEYKSWIAFKRQLFLMDINSQIQDGLDKGFEKGKKEGIKQGKEKGEKDKAKEIAKKMLEEKCEIELIIKVTGLTKEEIEELK